MCHKIVNLFWLQISSEFIGIWLFKSIVNITSSLKFAFNMKLEQGILDKTEKARGNINDCLSKTKKKHWKGRRIKFYFFYVNWKQLKSQRGYSTRFFLINFYWSTVALYCCVTFYCKTKWIGYLYTYIPLFFGFPSHLDCYRALSRVSRIVQ